MEHEKARLNGMLDDYLIGNLSEPEALEFEEHLFNCDECFQEFRIREQMVYLIRNESDTIFADYLEKRRAAKPGYVQRWREGFAEVVREIQWQWRLAPIAAGALALALWFIVRSFSPAPQSESPIAEQRVAPTPPDSSLTTPLEELKLDPKQLYAANFEPVPHLEAWIEESIRSEGTIIESVISPKIGEEIRGGEIVFQWKMLEKAPVAVKILNNAETEIRHDAPDLAHFPLITLRVKTEILKEPGLYYWKIEDESDLLFVGKFLYVKRNTKK